jgi:hypothetical protein
MTLSYPAGEIRIISHGPANVASAVGWIAGRPRASNTNETGRRPGSVIAESLRTTSREPGRAPASDRTRPHRRPDGSGRAG